MYNRQAGWLWDHRKYCVWFLFGSLEKQLKGHRSVFCAHTKKKLESFLNIFDGNDDRSIYWMMRIFMCAYDIDRHGQWQAYIKRKTSRLCIVVIHSVYSSIVGINVSGKLISKIKNRFYRWTKCTTNTKDRLDIQTAYELIRLKMYVNKCRFYFYSIRKRSISIFKINRQEVRIRQYL